MKTKPFLISTFLSTILQCLYYAVITGITLLILPQMMDTITNLPANGSPPPDFFNVIGFSSITGIIGFLLAPFVHAGTGALYAWLHRREEQPVTAEQGAMGGAAAAFTARFITGLFIALASLIVTNIMYQSMGQVFGTPNAPPTPFSDPGLIAFTSVFSIVGNLFAACFGSIIAAALGALGGALTGAMLK